MRLPWEDAWLLIIPGRRGHVFPWGGDRLAASTNTAGRTATRLKVLPGVEVWQDGSDGATVLFTVDLLDQVVVLLLLRRRRRLTPERRAKLIRAGREHRFGHEVQCNSRPHPDVPAGVDGLGGHPGSPGRFRGFSRQPAPSAMTTHIRRAGSALRDRLLQAGQASRYIKPASEVIGKGNRVVVVARVSTSQQNHSLNLSDQVGNLRRWVVDRGAVTVDEVRHVGSGSDPYWLVRPSQLARQNAAILLAESLDRFVRHPGFNPKTWPDGNCPFSYELTNRRRASRLRRGRLPALGRLAVEGVAIGRAKYLSCTTRGGCNPILRSEFPVCSRCVWPLVIRVQALELIAWGSHFQSVRRS
jgi:hypothetical protein